MNVVQQQQLDNIDKKLDKIQHEIVKDDLHINAHPILYVILVVVFFITMEFFVRGTADLIEYYHPLGKLSHWESMAWGFVFLGIIIILGYYSGIRIRLISDSG